MTETKDKTVKRFTVNGSTAHSHSQAIEYFKRWKSRYYPNDDAQILRIESTKAYIIHYVVKPKRYRRLD